MADTEEEKPEPGKQAEEEEDDYTPPPPPESGGANGAPMWIVTFADLATLMLTFFVLLLSFANMDILVFEELMGSVQEAFGSTRTEQGSHMLMQDPGTIADKKGTVATAAQKAQAEKRALAHQVADASKRNNFRDKVRINYTKDGVSVRIDSSVMFAAGSANMKKEMVPFLKAIMDIMKSFRFNLFIEGHTDNVPIKTRLFPSNWELSTVRATTVLRQLIKLGVPTDRLAAVGFADTRPIRDNGTAMGRDMNRRVEFKFIKIRTT